MRHSRAKKFGLGTAISLIIGSIVGIGIFFKNISVFTGAGGNGYTILIAWIISGLIALGAAITFAEVGTGIHGKAGLSNYSYRIIGPKFGKLSKIIEPTFYHSVLIFTLSCFAAEAIIDAFLPDGKTLNGYIHMGYIILIGIGIWLFFWILSIISVFTIGAIQNITVVLKFIPLIIVAIVGLSGIHGSHSESVFITDHFHDIKGNIDKIEKFSISSVIMLLPATLFAFDGFIHVTNISSDIENPKRNVPLAIILGMIGVIVMYLLITLGQLLTGQITPGGVLELLVHSQELKKIVNRILKTFIAISALGVCNGFVMSQVRSTEAAIEDKLLIGSKFMMKKFTKLYGFIYSLIIFLLTAAIISIPSIIKNTDSIIDACSNFPVLFFFILYGILILGQIRNRTKISYIRLKDGAVEVIRSKNQVVPTKNINKFIFYPLAILALLGITFTISYELFYASLYQAIVDPYHQGPFGLFHSDLPSQKILSWELSIIFFISLIAFIFIPMLIFKIQSKKML